MPEEGDTGVTYQNNTKWAGLKGWALFEQFMEDLDSGMVNDYNDDINTLLTFAGLFSAVVTAFLIDSYKWLQPDSLTTANQMLGQISQQIANSGLPPVDLNAATNFKPATSSVSINTLWFLALVLSLAAALFGMMAKQWLREYLRWTTKSGPSEIQVQLRQTRYEAFHEWRMPAIIASIPALLEAALMLFLVGMDILLWTLNGAVFGVCTVAIAALIVSAFITTILPVFCPRCPYKSPAGWACMLTWRAVARLCGSYTYGSYTYSLYNGCKWRNQDHCDRSKHEIATDSWKDWRDQDLDICVSIADMKMYCADGYRVVGRSANVQVLARALGWVRGTSQDAHLLGALKDCIPFSSISQDLHPFSRLVVHFHVACQVAGIDPSRLVPIGQRCVQVRGGASVLRTYSNEDDGHLRYHLLDCGSHFQAEELSARDVSSVAPSLRVHLAHMIASDLLAALDADRPGYVMDQYGKQAAYYLQGSALLGAFLAWTVAVEERQTSIALQSFADLLDRLLSSRERKLSRRFRPLPTQILPIVQQFEALLGCRLFFASVTDCRLTHVALKVPAGNPTQWSQLDCMLFVSASNDALEEWYTPRSTEETQTALSRLLDRMKVCAEHYLTLNLKNFGVPPLKCDWASHLRCLFVPHYSDRMRSLIPPTLFPHRLVDTLARLDAAGLIPGNWDNIQALHQRSQELQSQSHPTNESHDDVAANVQLETGFPTPPLNNPPTTSSSTSLRSCGSATNLLRTTATGSTTLPAGVRPQVVPAMQPEQPLDTASDSPATNWWGENNPGNVHPLPAQSLPPGLSASSSRSSVSDILHSHSDVDRDGVPSGVDASHPISRDTEDARFTEHAHTFKSNVPVQSDSPSTCPLAISLLEDPTNAFHMAELNATSQHGTKNPFQSDATPQLADYPRENDSISYDCSVLFRPPLPTQSTSLPLPLSSPDLSSISSIRARHEALNMSMSDPASSNIQNTRSLEVVATPSTADLVAVCGSPPISSSDGALPVSSTETTPQDPMLEVGGDNSCKLD